MKIKLKELRKNHKLSQLQVAKKAGIARSFISEVETGVKDNPSVDIICRLCKVLDCKPNDLIDCEED